VLWNDVEQDEPQIAESTHERRWRYDRKAATTVIGRKPGESCLMGLQDDRNPPAAAGQENGMRNPNGFLNDGQPRSLKRATPCKSGSGVVSSRCPGRQTIALCGGA